MTFSVILITLVSFSAFAGTKAAFVKNLRGDAEVLSGEKPSKLQVNDGVGEGAVIRTGENTLVKLMFPDKSWMNIGPFSEVKIGSESVELKSGKVRAETSGELLVKGPQAVVRVRKGDFLFSTNRANTLAVLFNGELSFNKLDNPSTEELKDIAVAGVNLGPGEFSVVLANRSLPTVPALLNILQREKLRKNPEFNSEPEAAVRPLAKSVVPSGLSGRLAGNDVDTLKHEVAFVIPAAKPEARPVSTSSDPDGFIQGEMLRPANGSFVHIDSGMIVPPGPDAVWDGNTNSYLPGRTSGTVNDDGNYLAPQDVKITKEGKVLLKLNDGSEKEVPPPVPIIRAGSGSIWEIAQATRKRPRREKKKMFPMPERYVPTGGIQGINDPTRFDRAGIDELRRLRSR